MLLQPYIGKQNDSPWHSRSIRVVSRSFRFESSTQAICSETAVRLLLPVESQLHFVRLQYIVIAITNCNYLSHPLAVFNNMQAQFTTNVIFKYDYWHGMSYNKICFFTGNFFSILTNLVVTDYENTMVTFVQIQSPKIYTTSRIILSECTFRSFCNSW